MRRNLFNTRNIYLCLIALSLTSVAGAKNICNTLCLQPYLGLEYMYEHISPAKNYRSILSADVQSGNFFIGTKFMRFLGVEVGYYRSVKTAQQQDQILSFNGVDLSEMTSTLTRTSFKGFSIDFAAYKLLDPNFTASLIAGFVTMHPTMTFQASGDPNFSAAFQALQAKNRTVPRLGMGLDLFIKHWGVRSRIFWVYTQSIKYNISEAMKSFSAISNHPYMQAIQVTAGVYYKF